MRKTSQRRRLRKRVNIQRDDLTTFGRTIDDEPPATSWRAPEWQALLKQTEELADRWATHSANLLRAGNQAGGNRAQAIADVLSTVERVAGPRFTPRSDLTEEHIEALRDPRWSRPPSAEVQAMIAQTHSEEDDWLLGAVETSRTFSGPPLNVYDDAAAIDWFQKQLRQGLSNNAISNAGVGCGATQRPSRVFAGTRFKVHTGSPGGSDHRWLIRPARALRT